MIKLKQSLVAFAGLMAIVGLTTLVTPGLSKGQGGNGPPTADVRVVNTPDVRDADNPARQGFQQEVGVKVEEGGNTGLTDFEVPAGKRLIIEYVSAEVHTPAGQSCDVRVGTFNNDTGRSHFFAATQVAPTNLGNDIMVSQMTRLYADPGTKVGVVVRRVATSQAGSLQGVVSISGYLVNVP